MYLRFFLFSAMGVSFFGCAEVVPRSAPAISILDQAMSAGTEADAVKVVSSIEERLPSTDGPYLELAFFAFRSQFSSRLAPHLSANERRQAFLTTFNGLTPRQMIILGTVLLGEKNSATGLSVSGARSERELREDHLQEHESTRQDIVVDAIRLYAK